MPITLLFKFLQQRKPVSIWLFEQSDIRIQGIIQGFDEFMNLVIANAVEVNSKTATSRHIGEILLKGDNITMVTSLEDSEDD